MHHPPHVFLCAGDHSGDIHGAALVGALREQLPEIHLSGLGGPAMEAAGCRLLHRLTDHAVMGFSRVVGSLPTFIGLLRDAALFLECERPDLCVLIDYPGFNLNLAALARRRSVPVVYYICPQLWAWASWRLRRFARRIDKALVIFPFEEDYFGQAGIETRWVGHPIVDTVVGALEGASANREPAVTPAPGAPICLLPGSRGQEIRANLPLMLEVAARLALDGAGRRVICAHLDRAKRALIEAIAAGSPRAGAPGLTTPTSIEIVSDYHAAIRDARLVLVTSGTATLEAALLGTPMVVVYRVAPPLRWAARHLLTVPHIAQVNLLAGRRIVPEFLTSGGDIEAITGAARALLDDGPTRSRCLDDLAALSRQVARPGAATRAARAILESIDSARAS